MATSLFLVLSRARSTMSGPGLSTRPPAKPPVGANAGPAPSAAEAKDVVEDAEELVQLERAWLEHEVAFSQIVWGR